MPDAFELGMIALAITTIVTVAGFIDETKVAMIFAGMLWVIVGLVFLGELNPMLLFISAFVGIFFMVQGVLDVAA